ncbi:MAG: hypothetical protein OEU76_08225, partial [Cyclobacteriaceae bacterium]|nr:hypothetical protein [Cyclobacteriaceae bacterium]
MSKTLEPIIAHLEESIKDEIFSKAEKRSLKSLIGDMPLDQHQLNFLRSKMYELANQKITPENYGFILEWIKNVNNTLVFQPQESSGAYFSPGDACRSAILSQINNAISTVKICVFTISDDIITNSIITSHKKGVNVQIIT